MPKPYKKNVVPAKPSLPSSAPVRSTAKRRSAKPSAASRGATSKRKPHAKPSVSAAKPIVKSKPLVIELPAQTPVLKPGTVAKKTTPAPTLATRGIDQPSIETPRAPIAVASEAAQLAPGSRASAISAADARMSQASEAPPDGPPRIIDHTAVDSPIVALSSRAIETRSIDELMINEHDDDDDGDVDPPVISHASPANASPANASPVTAAPSPTPPMGPPVAPSVPGAPRSSTASGGPRGSTSGHANVLPGERTDESQPSAAAPPPPRAGGRDEPPLLFEIAWEVCWQLGGIYTVLRTKAPAMQERWGNRYCLIGPYNPRTAAVEFEEQPTEGVIRQALDKLRDDGIPCHYGRWLIPGRPRVILLDYRARFRSLGEDKYLMWADHGISLEPGDGEVNEVVAFGFTVTQFFEALSKIAPTLPLLAHFHEWMGGVAVPRIAHLRLPVTTVFTTHATLLGRYLAGDMPNFYAQLPHVNPDAEAARYQILPRHLIEKAGAHASTVFTTVSDVTAVEAEKLLGRRPDVILPNGLNSRRFAALHEFQNLHLKYKERIHEFVMGHFFPSYTFDLDRTLYFFTSGRYEYKNKGLDIFIEALARLNERLKGMSDPPTVIGFIITRAATKNINVSVLQNQMQLGDLRMFTEEVQAQMGQRLFNAVASGRLPTFNELINEESWVMLKRAIHAQNRPYMPPIVTHDLMDDAHDPVLNHLRHRHLFNSADDPVKIIFHPEFVTATSPLLGLDYEQFVRGCHLGIFPSYYEPWGYTPMESIALGVPAVTTDLSGFGAYVQRTMTNYAEQGVAVLERRDHNFEESCEQLVAFMMGFAGLNRRQRIEMRNNVERLSERFDWSKLASHYHDAHDLALERTGGKRPGRFEIKIV